LSRCASPWRTYFGCWKWNWKARGSSTRSGWCYEGILLSVHAKSSEEFDRAKEIFERAGASDISYTTEASVNAPRKVAAR
jgi:hypothetical protein